MSINHQQVLSLLRVHNMRLAELIHQAKKSKYREDCEVLAEEIAEELRVLKAQQRRFANSVKDLPLAEDEFPIA